MDDERKAFLLDIAGPERVAALEAALDEMQAYAEEKGLTFKDIADAAFPDLQGVKDAGGDGETADGGDGEAEASANAGTPTAQATDGKPETEADADAGTAEQHAPASPAETPSAEDVADASKTFEAAMGGSDALVALTRVFAPAIREATAEAMEGATAPIIERLTAMAEEIEGLKTLAPIVAELTKDTDARIAEVIRPRTAPRSGGFSAAGSEETILGADAAKDVAEQRDADETADKKDMSEAQRAASPYIADALAAIKRAPGVQTMAPPGNTEAAG